MRAVPLFGLAAAAVTLLALSSLPQSEASNILMWLPIGGKSHYIVWQPLLHALAKRNHSLTVVSIMDDKKLAQMPNVRFIHLDLEHLAKDIFNFTEIFQGKSFNILNMIGIMQTAQEHIVAHEGVKKLMDERPQFDLSLVSPFCLDTGLYIIKNYFKSPVMYVFSAQSWPVVDRAMGNPLNPATHPLMEGSFGPEMTFWQRVQNAAGYVLQYLATAYYVTPGMERKIQEVLKLDHTPDLTELVNSAEFTLFNAYPVFESVRPINPNTAFVGGLHLRKAMPLPDDLKKWADDAKEGFVYISFGSALPASQMPEDKKQIFVNVLSKLKHKVLWKWETEEMEGKPDNVLLKKWLPQQDVLGHPNAKLFIGHAGLGGIAESVYHGVPIVTMPGFGDQFSNAARAARQGYGVQLNWKDLTEESFSEAINKALSSSEMVAAAKRYSSIMQDELVHPLDRAVHHVEYVIRHKGAKHLRSPANNLNWLQYYLLDVIAAVVVGLALAVLLVVKMAKAVFCRLFGKKPAAAASQKKKNN